MKLTDLVTQWVLDNMLTDPDERQAIEEMLQMPPEQLAQVPHQVCRWQCKVKLCKRYTRLWEFGTMEYDLFYSPSGIRNGDNNQVRHWLNTNSRFFLCGIHGRRYKGKPFEDIPLKKYENGLLVEGDSRTEKGQIIIL